MIRHTLTEMRCPNCEGCGYSTAWINPPHGPPAFYDVRPCPTCGSTGRVPPNRHYQAAAQPTLWSTGERTGYTTIRHWVPEGTTLAGYRSIYL